MQVKIKLKKGYRTALADGILIPDSPQHMTTEGFYRAVKGSRLQLAVSEYLYAVAVYEPSRKSEYIYSYEYQPEQCWTTYAQNLTPQSYTQEDFVFNKDCFFRVCVKRNDGKNMTAEDEERACDIVAYHHEEPEHKVKPCFQEEIKKTIQTIHDADEGNMLKLCLMADTHATVNGTWQDTIHNVQEVAKEIGYDAIIHLGDMTDGMVSKEQTKEYVQEMISDMECCDAAVYITPGNHDFNYFRNRKNMFSVGEMKELYRLPGETLDYYVDMPKHRVRMIFLSSFDDKEPVRYGYAKEQLDWIKEVLYSAESGTKFLIFSHDAPLAKLDYWSFLVRNGEELLDILEECNCNENYQIIGFFYGHVHGDAYLDECSFPVISVGCAKLEYFKEFKPEGVVAWPREENTVTQDLWDSLLIDFSQQRLTMVRFGAGEDRTFSFAKKESTYKQKKQEIRNCRKMKIWAHRGACAHAPENTIPAFELAYELGADGIELDVQMTKDGELVVIHDETIDRVSDGTGYVKDYTLEELRRYNFGKNFPAYGVVRIPTLEEVYDFVKTTDMTVNLELKNSVIEYEGLEEQVLRLAKEKQIEDRILYSSFNHFSVKMLKRLDENAQIAFLYRDNFLDMEKYAKENGAEAIHPSLRCLIQSEKYGQKCISHDGVSKTDIVKKCHQRGIKVHAWNVNEMVDFEKMAELSVDAVITNFVERG